MRSILEALALKRLQPAVLVPPATECRGGDLQRLQRLVKVKAVAEHLVGFAELAEVTFARFEADAALHMTGSGEAAWGTKHVMVAARGEQPHARMILSVAPVEKVGGEAKVAVESISRLAESLPGAQGVIYDGALRGTHISKLMHDDGLLTVSPVQARSGGRRTR